MAIACVGASPAPGWKTSLEAMTAVVTSGDVASQVKAVPTCTARISSCQRPAHRLIYMLFRFSLPCSTRFMAIGPHITHTSDVAILSRLIRPDDANLPPPVADAWLAIRFEQSDLDRMHELVTKNQDDKLNRKEKTELENYRRVSFLLDLMHSKARRSLKKHQAVH
jgi:hypothetical protein